MFFFQIVSEKTMEIDIDRQIHLRNRCLRLLHQLYYDANNIINWKFCDEMARILGLEWVLLLMQPHLHHTSIVWAFRLLVTMLTRESIIARFREVKCASAEQGYLKNTEMIMHSQNAIILSSKSPFHVLGAYGCNTVLEENSTFNQASHQLMGFSYLEWLLMHRTNVSEVFSLLIALIIGIPVKSLIEPSRNNNLESIWSFVWSSNIKLDKLTFCTEAVCILFSLIRSIVHCKKRYQQNIEENISSPHWIHAHPCETLKLFTSFYKHLPDFVPVAMSREVITSLISIRFDPTTVLLVDPSLEHHLKFPVEGVNHQSNMDSSFAPASELTNEPKNSRSSSKNTTPEIEPQSGTMCNSEPTTAQVMDILQALIIDSLLLMPYTKTPPVIDLVLDFYISGSIISLNERKTFLTEIILLLMKNASLNDITDGQKTPFLNNNDIKFTGQEYLLTNIFYMTARFVDKLWQQMLLIDGREVFDYCVTLLNHVKRTASRTPSLANNGGSISCNGNNYSSANSLDSLYRSLNRCILYLLAYPPAPFNITLIDILNKLMYNRLLVFGAGNHDPDFIGCLTYCIIQLHKGDKPILHIPSQFDQQRTTTRYVELFFSNKSEYSKLEHGEASNGSSTELERMSFRVWEELYVCKKPVIEEVFKVTLASPFQNCRAPNIKGTYDQIIEPAFKHWLAYVEGEKNAVIRNPWDVHNNIQSKIQKVTGGLTRLTSRTKLKKDISERNDVRFDQYNTESNKQLVNAKITLIEEFWNFGLMQQENSYVHTKRYVYQDWLQIEAELIRERAIWGPKCCAEFTKWTLDNTEGPYRMRRKMMKNVFFYLHYPPKPDSEESVDPIRPTKSRVASSYDSAKYSKFVRLYRNMFPEQFEQDVTPIDQSKINGSIKCSEYPKHNR